MYNFALLSALLSLSMLVFGLLASVNVIDFNMWSAAFLYLLFKHVGEIAFTVYNKEEE